MDFQDLNEIIISTISYFDIDVAQAAEEMFGVEELCFE